MKPTTPTRMTDVVVVGGGPAGMMAAITAASHGRSVMLAEKNPILGKKLNITGKGRCNLTNNCDVRNVVANTPRGGSFLYSALTRFPPSAVVEWFESRGLPTVTERGNRVFPASERAADVTAILKRELKRLGVKVEALTVKSLIIEDSRCVGIKSLKGEQRCKGVVLATGGLSYPLTGSTGDGYRLASEAGHSISELRASIVPLNSPDKFCAEMTGLALVNVKVTAFTANGKRIYDDFGELLFTHFGVSGPVALSASAHILDFPCYLQIDLKSALDEAKLDARLLRDFAASPNKSLGTVCGGLLPRSMIAPLLEQAGLDASKECNNITKIERQMLLKTLKNFRVSIDSTRPIDESVVTRGGVVTDEIEPRTMESRLCKGLFFAGEIIDADAYTGGYNLQIAWSTGHAAGENAGVDKE